MGRSPPSRRHLALLQHAEQVDLCPGRQLADLVEEERAPASHLEPAGLLAVGAAEGPLLVAEQLAVDERLGQGADARGDERPRPAGAGVVQGPGDQLLARAALPLDHHGDIGVGDLGDLAEQLGHRGARADDLGQRAAAGEGQAIAQPDVLLSQPVVLERVTNLNPQRAQVHRLGDVIVGAQPHRLHGGLDRPMRRDHDQHRRRPLVLDVADQVQPRELPGHPQVLEDQVRRPPAHGLQGLERVAGRGHLVVVAGQGADQAGPDARLIIHDQDAKAALVHFRLGPRPPRPGGRRAGTQCPPDPSGR